ncbi:MAG: DUF72 domain-containing protein [Gammaproteobacteria bacterium]
MADIRIGISGWRYAPWRDNFYPGDLAQKNELSYAASKFPIIEINGSFYSLQRPTSYALWYAQTPKNFVFSIKGPRFITPHPQAPRREKPLANFFASGVLGLKEKLGPLLWAISAELSVRRAAVRRVLRSVTSRYRGGRSSRPQGASHG